MPALLVNCHRCQREFASEVSLTEGRIQGNLIDGVVYCCPYCGVRDPYFTAEHHLPQSGGFAARHSARPAWAILGHPHPLPSTPSRGRGHPTRARSGP
jgi:hypothetical protein